MKPLANNLLKKILKKRSFLLFIFVLLISCASMMTFKEQYLEIEEMVAQGDFSGAIAQLEASKEKYYEAKDRVLYYLDLGMLCHYNGEYQRSNEILTEAEYAIEELFTKSISEAATSLLLNDNALAYAGEDYEDIYINVFKALNYLYLDLFDDAIVEIKRVGNKLNLLEDKYKDLAAGYSSAEDAGTEIKAGTNNFYNSALSRYISMLIYRAEGEPDNARIDKEKVEEAFNLEANIYNFAMPQLDTYLQQKEQTKVNFLCFTGRGPDKIANTLYIHTEDNLLLVVPTEENEELKQEISGWASISFPVEAGYHFKFQLPFLKLRGSIIREIQIKATGVQTEELERLESLENVAVHTFDVKKPIIYVKSIIRPVIKGLIAAEGKKAMDENLDPGLSCLLGMATDVAVDLTENADLRISHFFPANAYVGEVEMEPGTYDITIEYYGEQKQLVFADKKKGVNVQAGKLNLLESFCLE